MPQSRSQGRRAPTSSGSLRPLARAGSLGSTSSNQHSQGIKDIENDIDALTKEVDRLGKEFIEGTNEYSSSFGKARQLQVNARSQIFTDFLAKMQDISLNSKPEDVKKEAYEELETAAKNKLREIQGRIDNQAKEIEAEEFDFSKNKAAKRVMNRAKANAIRDNAEEIKKVAGTAEGIQAIERCRTRLDKAYRQVESKLESNYEQYLTKMVELTEKQKKVKETLDKMNIPEVPEDRAEAATRVNDLGSWDPKRYGEYIRNEDADDRRMKLLRK